MVIECDGCQHHSPEGLYQDQQRDKSLQQKGFEILRFDNREILTQLDAVCLVIAQKVTIQLNKILPNPPL